jgi:hypothetical protein
MNHSGFTAIRPRDECGGFASTQRASALWLGKPCVIVAWLGIFLALAAPPDGFGIPVCWLQSATGIPCLGCGLTRSLSCAIRGLFLQSWHYHPMGLSILVLFLFTATQSVLPKIWRERLKMFLQSRATVCNSLYLGFVGAFVAYGTGRALLHCVGR